jgi:pimeloyl-ACP methyl ester carboxylesterase
MDAPLAPPAPRLVPVPGAQVPVLELGDPDGPVAVLVPGLSDGLAPVTDARTRALLGTVPLPMTRVRCLVVSHRVPLDDQASTRSLAADLAAVLETEVAGPAVLICHSMGAMVAQHLAADAPHLVDALVLSATAAVADDGLRSVLARWDALVAAGDGLGFASDAVRSSFTGDEVATRLALVAATDPQQHRLTAPARRRHALLSRACADHDARDRLGSVRCPTLVLAGARDEVVAPRNAVALAETIDRAELHVLDGVGHGFPEQAPARYEALVTAFLSRLPGWGERLAR